ncbi:MAG: PEP-CTERM sorting domain-containing protein, partial [Tepidisphaerales bacterium]
NIVLAWLLGASFLSQTCHAQVFSITSFRDLYYTQTSDSAVAAAGAGFNMGLSESHVGDFSAVSATYPGPGSPLTLPPPSFPGSQAFNYYSPTYATKAAMDAAFPGGTYVFNATGAAGPATATVDYPADAYSPSLPMLAGTTFSDLQSLDPGQIFTLQFSSFVLDPKASIGYLDFVTYDLATQAPVFYRTDLPSSTTTLDIPAGAFLPNHAYSFALIYDDSLYFPSSGALYDTHVGFDNRTSGQFTTVPEPSSATLLLVAIGLVGRARHWRHRRKLPCGLQQ